MWSSFRLALLLLVAAGFAAAPAQAANEPFCYADTTWARPGLERSFEVSCASTDEVRLLEAPAHGRLEGLVLRDRRTLSWRFRPDEDAPARDAFRLELTGPGGTSEHAIEIINVPLSENTPPTCNPVQVALRTSGAESAEVGFDPYCFDADHDEMTIEGGGPGEHLSTPAAQGGGGGHHTLPHLRYRTATHSGDETATIRATDGLGARSEDAAVSVTVGPGVDRLPECRPNRGDSLHARPGVSRSFAIVCTDADGDPFDIRLAEPPTRGSFTRFEAEPGSEAYGTRRRFVDATYVPAESYVGDDSFTVVANGPRGDGPPRQVVIRTRPPSENGGASCGWGVDRYEPDRSVRLEASCFDEDGDPLTATVTEAPRHGVASQPVSSPAAYGQQMIRVSYVPQSGYLGPESLELTVQDGLGDPTVLRFEFPVRDDVVYSAPGPNSPPPTAPSSGAPDRPLPLGFPAPIVGPPVAPPAVGGPPVGALVDPPAIGPPDAVAPDAVAPDAVAPADQARRTLETPRVRLVRTLGTARLYAPAGAVAPRAPALALTCALRCTAQVDRRLELRGGRGAGPRRLLAGPRQVQAGPQAAGDLRVRLSARQQRAVRRAGGGWAHVHVTVREGSGRVRSGRVRLALAAR